MPRSKTITMGGQDYLIEQMTMRANRDFRNTVSEPVRQVVTLLENNRSITLNTVGDLAQVVNVLNDVVLGSMDLLLDALFRYSPALAADRERIEQEAYDDEAIAALGVVASLAYPLDRLATIWSGPPATPTSPNSPSTSGANGTPAAIPVRRTNT